MKLSDWVLEFVAQQGIRHLFMLPGGGAMHLNESLGQRRDIEYVCALHEQGAAIAAEAYAKITNDLSALMVTTGPGGTNAVTGVMSAWLDSMPMLVLSGQVKRADLKRNSGVRILGVQEVDIVSIASQFTKYAVTIDDPTTIRYHLEKAVHLAREGRRGPVWIDIPLDVQGATVEPGDLAGYTPPPAEHPDALAGRVDEVLALLADSKRPVILAGAGIRASGAADAFLRVIDRLDAPVLTTWLAMDLIPDDHPLHAGRPGAIAPRGANFTLQNADLLLVVGSRLDMALTGYAHENLARAATKVIVDIDGAEIAKMRTRIDVPIIADAGDFLRALEERLSHQPVGSHREWVATTQSWKERYPLVRPEHRDVEAGVSTYCLADALSDELGDDDIVATGSSGAAVELFLLAFRAKAGQRVIHSRGLGAMGFGIPASLGACLASGGRRTICVEGDGSFHMNAQELATISRLSLPIKIFVVNNDGYASIRSSQRGYFDHLVAADPSSGLTLPSIRELATAYGLAVTCIEDQADLRGQVRAVLEMSGPVVCEVVAPMAEERAPRLSTAQRPDGSLASRPLEDLWPFLDRDELHSNMFIPLLES